MLRRPWVALGLRFVPALLLGSTALMAGAAQPAAAASDTMRQRSMQWLARIHDAALKRNYQGTYVVSAGGLVASARIAHYCKGGDQYERIEALDGQKRQVYRHNELVHSFWPREQLAVVETRSTVREFPALLAAGTAEIAQSYDIGAVEESRVAGLQAGLLELKPKDGWRYGWRLWADQGSGLLLRAEIVDRRGTVLEATAFSDVLIGVKPQPQRVLQAMQRLEGYEVRRPALVAIDLQAEGWQFDNVPPGFRLVSSIKRSMAALAAEVRRAADRSQDSEAPSAQVLQAIFSDGMTHVSVFIEPYKPARHRREMLVATGATQTLARRQGDWWITVVGDVPAVTLRAFAAGLEHRR